VSDVQATEKCGHTSEYVDLCFAVSHVTDNVTPGHMK